MTVKMDGVPIPLKEAISGKKKKRQLPGTFNYKRKTNGETLSKRTR
jgi:hypothetical protein